MNQINGFAVLGSLGVTLDTEIEGKFVVKAQATNQKNTFALTLADDAEGTKNPRQIFVAKKLIDEGILAQNANGAAIINAGFDLFQNPQGQWVARNKTRANQELKVL